MGGLFLILIGITVLFFFILAVKEFLGKKNKEKVCAICSAASLTWIVLLVLFWLGKFGDKTIIALMMGMTLLGIYYVWERKAEKEYLIFRLPILLAFILIGYSLIEGIDYSYNVFIFLAILWVAFLLVFLYGRGGLIKKLVECCKKW